MGRMSRQKGKRAERQAAKMIRDEWGIEARRGRQYSGSPDSPDVEIAIHGMHIEVKHREVGEGQVRNWLREAEEDSGWYDASPDTVSHDDTGMREVTRKKLPVLLHRKNGEKWLLTIQAAHAVGFARGLLEAQKK